MVIVTRTDIANVVILREQGKTYQEIADVYGVSRQYVSQLINKFEMSFGRVRKGDAKIEKIVFSGIYDFFIEHPELTLSKFCKLIYERDTCPSERNTIENFVKGTDTRITIKRINKIIEIIGKPYDEIFKLRDVKGA